MSEHVLDHLSAYLDGALARAEQERFRAHLAECGSCAKRLEELAAVDGALRTLPFGAPERYFDELPGRLRTRLAAAPAPGRRLAKLPVWTLALAATLLVGVLAPLTLVNRGLSNVPAPAATRGRDADRRLRDDARIAPPATSVPAAPGVAGAPPASIPAAREDAPRGELLELKKARAQSNAKSDARAPRMAEEVARPAVPAPAAPPAAAPSLATPAPTTGAQAGFAAPPAAADQVAQLAGPRVSQNQQQERRKEEVAESIVVQAEAPKAAGRLAGGGKGAEKDAQAAIEPAPSKRAAEPRRQQPSEGFRTLQSRVPRNAAEARAQREAWRRLAVETRDAGEADEARVAAIAAGVEAWRFERQEEDRRTVERDAAAYLSRADAHQRERVRELLLQLER